MNYTSLADDTVLNTAVSALSQNGFSPEVVADGVSALARIKELIPESASVMNGSSTTLNQIGFIDYLKSGEHKWNNLHEAIVNETDSEKQNTLRKLSVTSDYYLGSVHALTQSGELVIASNSGSQLPHLAFTSPNIILVVSTQKIVKDLGDAFKRIDEHVLALEDERMNKVYGFGTFHAKTLILHKENPAMGRRIIVLLVKEKLGF
jgi:LUD domain